MTRADFQPGQARGSADRVAVRARPAEHKGGGAAEAADDAGFPGLLSRMEAAGPGRADKAAAAQEPGEPPVEHWLRRGQADQGTVEDGEPGVLLPADGTDLSAITQDSAQADVPAPLGATDMGALYRADRMLGASFLTAMVVDGAVVAGDGGDGGLATGTVPAADPRRAAGLRAAPMPVDPASVLADVVAPEEAQQGSGMAPLAAAGPKGDIAVAGGPLPVVAVVRRETHLAPVDAAPFAPRVAEQVVAGAPRSTVDQKAGQVDIKAAAVLPVAGKQPRGAEAPVLTSSASGARGKPLGQPLIDASPAKPAVPLDTATGQGPVADEGVSDIDRALSVAGREDHLAPQSPPSPARQVAERIVAATVAGGREPHTVSSVSAHATPPAAHPVRVLHLQLHPAELGTVTVRMTLKSDAIEIQLEAGRQDTAQLLLRDRDAISSLLRSAGYQVDALVVRVASPGADASLPSTGSSPALPDSAMQSQPGASQSDGRASGGRAHAQPDSDRAATIRSNSDEDGRTASRVGDDLYV